MKHDTISMVPVSTGKVTNDPHVVVMIEPRASFEPELKVSEQINEVFGPFATGKEAELFTARVQEWINEPRQWLIIPLSKPSSINAIDPTVN